MIEKTMPNIQPKSTSFVPLARSIPEHRQVKLAGQRRVGPIRNIAPSWSNINQSFTLPNSSGIVSPSHTIPIQPKSVKLEIDQSPINSEISQLEKQLTVKKSQLDLAAKQNTKQHVQMVQLEREKEVADAVTSNLKAELTNMTNTDQNNTNDIAQKIEAKEVESQSLRDEIDALKNQLSEEQQLQQEITNYQKQIGELKAEQERLHNLFLNENKKVESLTEQLKEKQAITEQPETETKYQGMIEKAIQTPQETSSPARPAQKKVVQAKVIQTSESFPALTQERNAINGVVKDSSGKMIDNAIVIIKDKASHNLRALKTNQLGQFVAATPLSNGEYFIDVQKSGFQFDLASIFLTGDVLPPIEIVSTH